MCVRACVAVTAVVAPPPPMGERSIVMTVSVCLSVCLSVREHVSSRAYSKRVSALIVHSELKSVHFGFTVAFICKHKKHKLVNK